MAFHVEGKTAFVTGANRGIGQAIVVSLVEQGASKVYAAVRDISTADSLVKQFGSIVVPTKIDLAKPDTIKAAAAKTADVELVVNNAGVLRTSNALADDAVDSLRFEMEVNVYGLMWMASAFAPILKTNGGGAFVQLNSAASLKCFSDFATYSASKAASYSITQGLRETLADQGTHVLSVHPGPIATAMAHDAGIAENAEPPSVVSEGIVAALAAGSFHLFPDSMAKQIGAVYRHFAEYVIEANLA